MSDTKQQTTGAEGGFEFVTGDILDATAMVAKLRDPKDPLSRYLVGRFRPEATKALESFDGSRRRSDALVKALVEELNQVIADPDFYDAKRFEQVAPSGSTRILMDADPQRRALRRARDLHAQSDRALLASVVGQSHVPEQPQRGVQTARDVGADEGLALDAVMLQHGLDNADAWPIPR